MFFFTIWSTREEDCLGDAEVSRRRNSGIFGLFGPSTSPQHQKRARDVPAKKEPRPHNLRRRLFNECLRVTNLQSTDIPLLYLSKMKINSLSLLAANCVSSFVATSTIVAEGATTTTNSAGRELFSPLLSGGEPVPEAEGLNDTELIAKIESCKAAQDNRKTAFLLPFLTEEFLNSREIVGHGSS